MAFGIDDAIMLMMAASSAYSAMNPPENNFQSAAGSTGMPTSAGGSPMQPARAPRVSDPPKAMNAEPLQNLASELAKTGQPPPQQAPIMPTTKGTTQMGPPSPSQDPIVQAQQNQAATQSIWAALPQAIAMAAPLLGAGQEHHEERAAPTAGGPGGANAMQSPGRRPTIGEILNSIPRYR